MNILGNKHLQLQPLTRENAIDLRFIALAMNDRNFQELMNEKINNPVKDETYGIFYDDSGKLLIVGFLELKHSALAYNVGGFIAPNYRRNHYMSNVIETVIAKFPATAFYFDVDANATPAQLMLEKLGAKVLETTQVKKVYYILGNPHM